MNRFIRPFLLMISSILIIAQISNAQEFPETKKQAFEWLTASEWKLKWLVIDERKLDAELNNMHVSISFMADSTYEMIFMSEIRKGRFVINMEEKYIRLINDKKANAILVSSLSINELWLQSQGEGDEEPLMILLNYKKI